MDFLESPLPEIDELVQAFNELQAQFVGKPGPHDEITRLERAVRAVKDWAIVLTPVGEGMSRQIRKASSVPEN